jgi:small subunit ribosomal protein S28e
MIAIPAEIIQIQGTLGIKGVSRVRAKVLDGRDKNKIIVRNVIGPVMKGDVILIKGTELDAEAVFR